jgi:proline iminopeptidase
MDALEQHRLTVDDASLEVFLGGTGSPLICQSHPFVALSADPHEPEFSWMDWDPTLGRLIRINPRGVGQSLSAWQPDDATFERHIDDLEAVRQQLGGERWVFWGAASGGCTGLLYALRYPHALRGLIIAAMGPSGPAIAADARSVLSPRHPENQPYVASLSGATSVDRRPAVLGELDPALALAEWVRLGSDDEGEIWGLRQERLVLIIDGSETRVWAALEQFGTGFDVRERLAEIRVPALIFAGLQDPYTPLTQCERLQAGLPQASLAVLAESGHVQVDRDSGDAERFRAAVRHFLASLPTEPTSAAPPSARRSVGYAGSSPCGRRIVLESTCARSTPCSARPSSAVSTSRSPYRWFRGLRRGSR